MNVIDIPFNKFLGIMRSEKPGYILMADASPDFLNHLGTVHASVQFALAEATSGEYLSNVFIEYKDSVLPVVRRVEVKYSKPANGEIYSKAEISGQDIEEAKANLYAKGRALIRVNVKVYDMKNLLTMQSVFEWFVQKV